MTRFFTLYREMSYFVPIMSKMGTIAPKEVDVGFEDRHPRE